MGYLREVRVNIYLSDANSFARKIIARNAEENVYNLWLA